MFTCIRISWDLCVLPGHCLGLSMELGFVDTVYQQGKLGFEPSLIAVLPPVVAQHHPKMIMVLIPFEAATFLMCCHEPT